MTMIYKQLVSVASELSKLGISKDRKNQSQGFNFRGVDDVYGALSPILAAHNVVIIPVCEERTCEERQTKSGGSMYSVAVRVRYKLCAEDGSSVDAVVYGEAMDSGDKATNKALSAAYKYMAFQCFCIPLEGHEDADTTTPEPSSPVKPMEKKAPIKEVKAFEFAEEAIEAIKACNDAKELATGHIVARLKASKVVGTLKGADYDSVKAAYEARIKELSNA